MQCDRERKREMVSACRNNHGLFFNSLAKTISPVSGHLVQTPLGTPSRDFTVTFEYLGLLNNAIFKISLSVPQGEDVHLVDSTFYENLGAGVKSCSSRENVIDENHCFFFIKGSSGLEGKGIFHIGFS